MAYQRSILVTYILHIDNVHHYHISNAISVQVRARNRSRNRDFLDKKQRQRLKQNFGKKNAEGPLVKWLKSLTEMFITKGPPKHAHIHTHTHLMWLYNFTEYAGIYSYTWIVAHNSQITSPNEKQEEARHIKIIKWAQSGWEEEFPKWTCTWKRKNAQHKF